MRGIAISLTVGCALAAHGCATSELSKAETVAAKIFISDEQEKQIGLQVAAELEQKQKIRYLDDQVVSDYVRGVAERILASARRDRPGVEWQVHVIDDAKTVNAFATPGGFVYVYTGLLLAAADESELAGVLAHESGHVVARHSARQIVDAYGLEAVTALALGKNPGLLGKLASTIAVKGALLAHSRSEESEADEYGARYTSAAGCDPHGLVRFFEKLMAKEGHAPAVLTWLSDHPATTDRIARVNRYIDEHKLDGHDRGEERFAPIKQRLEARAPRGQRQRFTADAPHL